MEQKKETPEEMDKRIRAELKAEAPPPVGNSEPAFSTAKGKSSGGDGFSVFNMKFLAAVFIIGLIVSYLVVTFVGVSPLTANINTVKKTADTAQASASAAVDAANKAQTTANNATNTAQTNLQTAINTLQGKIDGINASMTTLQGKNYVTPDQISKFATTDQLSKVATNEQIANLQTQLDALKKQLANDETAIAAIQSSQKTDEAAITKLQTAPTTTATTTTPVGAGVNGVSATIVSNAWGGGQTINFNPIATTNTSESGSFNFTINNSTTATANNIQLAIGLQSFLGIGSNMTGTPLDLNSPLYNVTVSVNINGSMTVWTSQNTNIIGLLGYENTVASSGWGSFGTISQPVGTSSPYTVTITVTSGNSTTALQLSSFTIIPIIKVVGFTN